ncbi:MAG: tetratricopeptide repeat protein [Verrucomicrobiia bacterium]
MNCPPTLNQDSVQSSHPASLDSRWTILGVCLALAALTLAVFGQTLRHGFVSYDDHAYVCENPAVIGGLNLKGVEWAFTHVVLFNWHPLTMMSHMLDCQLYGLNAGGHHLTSVLLHTASVILLLLVLRQMTGALWRSALVAAVFAIHPLRVESVAWVAERKDVLSGLFFMLTLWAYTRYAQGRLSVERRGSSAGTSSLAPNPRPSPLDYCLVLLFFALGLLCKPMLVSLPFVLLLLDYWPLNRFAPPIPAPAATGIVDSLKNHFVPWRLILEKVPLVALSGAACMVTMATQKDIIAPVPLGLRIGNAVVSYVVYLRQMVWPAGLAVLYPYPRNGLPGWEITLAVVLLAAISAGVFLRRQKQPYLLIGWLWYLGMLVPAIGLVQSGWRAHADRYTYLPQIGLYFALTWAAGSLCAGLRYRCLVLGAVTALVITALSVDSFVQTSYWRNSESLWTHTLACTWDNALAHNNLGNDLLLAGQADDAITHFQKAVEIQADYSEAYNNLGNALLQEGRVDEAITHYQKALEIKPNYAEAYSNLGNALLQKGRVDEAIAHFQKALEIQPEYAKAHYNLGNALLQKGRVDEAIAHFQEAVEIRFDYAEACNNLGNALLQEGRVDEAIAHYEKALEINPGYAEARNNLGNALLQKGRVDEAILQFQKAVSTRPEYAKAHNNLGHALLQKGRVDEAITHFQKALEIRSDYPDAGHNLARVAWLLATSPEASVRNGAKAIELAEAVERLSNGKDSLIVMVLAAAYAEAGRFPEAVATAERAQQLAAQQGNASLADVLGRQIKLYQAGTPFRDTNAPVATAPFGLP